MKKNKYTALRNVCLWLIAIGFIAAGAFLAVRFFIDELWVYIALGASLGVGVIFLLILLCNIKAIQKAIAREEDDLIRDIHMIGYGEKKIIGEQGHFYGELRREINVAQISHKEALPYGVYEEDVFDDVLLTTLEDTVTAQAGLAYFDLTAPKPIASEEPEKALLVMAKNYFGEKAYYGKRHNGLAVFVPYLGSQEEMMGRVRKVVQMFSYSEEDNHINAKAGVAFYPELSPRNMTSTALKATVTAAPLSSGRNEEEVPLVGYKAAETVSILLAGKLLNKKMQEVHTRAEASAAFKEFVAAVLPSLGADVVDVFTYDEASVGYRLEEEVTRLEGTGFSGFAEEGIVSVETLGPIYEWSKRESGLVAASDDVYLPEEIKAKLENLGLKSIAAYAIHLFGRQVGLLLLGANEYPLTLSYGVQRYFSYAERYLQALIEIKERDRNQARVGAMLASFEHYAYGIQGGSYSLSYISPNLQSAIPEAKLGMPCYQALFGLKKPCKDCPLFRIGVEKVMPSLSSGVFAFRALPGDGESLMVLSPHESDFASSRLDYLTGFLSDASLHEDLQNEILIKGNHGQVLAFRIRNADSIRGGFRLTNTDEVVRVAAEALISARLARGVYRNGEIGFAYLLPFASKKEAIDLAEKVSRTLSAKLPFHDKQIELYLDFALMSYPVEVMDVFSFDSVLRVLYSKADASSRGRLFEVSHPEGRMVDHDYHAKMKLEECLRAGVLPVRYCGYEELSGTRVVYQVAYSAMKDEDGNYIEEERVRGLTEDAGKASDGRVAMVRNIVKYMAKAGEDYPSIILPIMPVCFKEDFVRKVDELFVRDQLPRKKLIFEVEASDIKDPEFKKFLERMKGLGYGFGLSNYKGGLSEEELQPFNYVEFDAECVYGVHKSEFLLGLSSVRRLGLNVLVKGFHSKEAKHYLASLSFHYGQAKDAPYLTMDELLGEEK